MHRWVGAGLIEAVMVVSEEFWQNLPVRGFEYCSIDVPQMMIGRISIFSGNLPGIDTA